MQRDESLLQDMLRAADQIEQFKGRMDFEQFRVDAKTQSAILHQFLLIGEIAKLLSDDFKKAHASVPWSVMARMRDKLIHHYRGVDLREIFNAADMEIPKLTAFLPPAIAQGRIGGGQQALEQRTTQERAYDEQEVLSTCGSSSYWWGGIVRCSDKTSDCNH